MKKCQTLPYILNFDVIECVRRNRRPQANKTLETTSPSTPLEKFIPKQKKSIKSPSRHRKSYVPKHWLITPQANPKQTQSKPQGIRPEESRF